MRYIDIRKLELPENWLSSAEAAKNAVAKGENPNKYESIWQEIKGQLEKLFPDKKCWYCETSAHRDDNAVDHFRPKNRVKEAPTHKGYSWLAFEFTNYRYACMFCNSARKGDGGIVNGKADHFPLLDEAKRVYHEGPLDEERPALLDPCQLSDWRLLGCHVENGKPCATTNEPTEKGRADTSIKVYHLDYGPTCKKRHSAAMNLLTWVDNAKRNFTRASGDLSDPEFNRAAEQVRRAIDRSSEFSGEMIYLLRAKRHSDHPWIQTLLET